MYCYMFMTLMLCRWWQTSSHTYLSVTIIKTHCSHPPSLDTMALASNTSISQHISASGDGKLRNYRLLLHDTFQRGCSQTRGTLELLIEICRCRHRSLIQSPWEIIQGLAFSIVVVIWCGRHLLCLFQHLYLHSFLLTRAQLVGQEQGDI